MEVRSDVTTLASAAAMHSSHMCSSRYISITSSTAFCRTQNTDFENVWKEKLTSHVYLVRIRLKFQGHEVQGEHTCSR